MARPLKNLSVVAANTIPTPNPIQSLPPTGFLKLWQIIGKPKANPPIPGLIPVSGPTWYNGIKAGRFPKGIKLGPNSTAWRVEDILQLIEKLAAG